MKRLSLLGFFGMLASVLAGCPIFSGDGGGGDTCAGEHCASTGTYVGGCSGPADCNQNETCGADRQCHSGDCTSPSTGCVAGYTCMVDPSTQVATCVGGGTGGGGTGGGGTGGAGTGGSGTSTASTGTTSTASTGTGGAGGSPVYCGHPSDCPKGEICGTAGTCKPGPCSTSNACIFGYTCAADGTCQGGPNTCDSNASCASPGYVCIAGPATNGGTCTKPADQCFDQSQCDAGDKCVAGKCVVACTTVNDTHCRDGFLCDTTLGICATPAKTCNVTNDCASATTVCVGGTCVPRSPSGVCPMGDVWDENGCIPNQAASFTCNVDGVQDACATGSICLHHSCWISCDAPNATICDNQPALNKCKPVTSSSGMHNVCGTSTNLGGMCDPTANNNCSGGKVCIDGFCK